MNGNLRGINYEGKKMLFLPDTKLELGPMHLFGIYICCFPLTLELHTRGTLV